MKSKKTLLVVLSFLAVGLLQLEAQNIYITEKSGTQTTISLSDIHKITFSSGNMTVETSGGSNEFALNNLLDLNFRKLSTDIGQSFIPESMEFTIYPNPVMDVLSIKTNNLSERSKQFDILSLEGRVLRSEQMNSMPRYSITVNDLPTGMYLLRISDDKQVKVVTFIKN